MDFIKSFNTEHTGGIFTLTILDQETFITGSNDRKLKVWNMSDFKMTKEVKFASDITSVSTLPRNDGSTMILVGLFQQFALLN
jgi:hypothetical protein